MTAAAHHPKQLHVMQPRSTETARATLLQESHSNNLVAEPKRFGIDTSEVSPSFSRSPNISDTTNHNHYKGAQNTPQPVVSNHTNTYHSTIMTHSATLLLLLFLLPLIALFIYNVFRKLWNKITSPRHPSTRQADSLGHLEQEQQKRKPMKSALVVVLANALARPDVQLLNRVRRQFVDEEYASSRAQEVSKAECIVGQHEAPVEAHLLSVHSSSKITEPQNENSQEKVESVISEKPKERLLVEGSSEEACRICGQASVELEERCHSHSPRTNHLSFAGQGQKTLAAGCSVSPIMLNCEPELGSCSCKLAASESGRRGKLASRRLLRQPTDSGKHRCLKLFYEDYYVDEEAHESEKREQLAYRRLEELELASSTRGLQESAQELMELAESDQSLYSATNPNGPNKINPNTALRDRSTMRCAAKRRRQQAAPQLAADHLRPNGSEGELASSTSTSLGGSDSGFGACRMGAVECVACRSGAASYPASCSTPSSSLGGGGVAQKEPKLSDRGHSKPMLGKSSSAGKWRVSQRQQVVAASGLMECQQSGSARAARRMSVAGDQVCSSNLASVKNAPKLRNESPRILPRYTRRPSDTYLYGASEPGAEAEAEDGYHKSAYSSSGGSSSGIGVSGSACTNTPTARAFPYSSFVDADSALANTLACQLMDCTHPLYPANLVYHNRNAVLANLLTTHQDHHLTADGSPASRKYSLPVQLEWRANERVSPKNGTRPLFDANLQQAHQQLPAGLVQQLTCDDFGGASIASSLRPEETRRSSQTITRQSSFWLTEQSDDSVLSLANTFDAPLGQTSTDEPPLMDSSSLVDQQPPQTTATRSARASLSSIAVLSGDSIESVKRRPLATSTDKTSAQAQTIEAPEKEEMISDPSAAGERHLSARNSSSTATSNSTGADSPSPPVESSRAGNRTWANARSSGLIKRPKLKTKRHQKSEDIASKRRRAFKMRTGVQQHSAPSASNRAKDEQWDDHDDNDDDDLHGHGAQVAMMHSDCPFGPMQSTCSLPQHIRKAGTTSHQGTSTLKSTTRSTKSDKKDSANLERQCRELWKLRATLHDDSCFSDNWANYHQRLNRRYDSGYKSIEHQFSSSFEGPIRASTCAQASGASLEAPRPPSSCSNQPPTTTTTNQIENKMSHLELAEDQNDTPTPNNGDRECHSRSSECSSGSSKEDENNNKM